MRRRRGRRLCRKREMFKDLQIHQDSKRRKVLHNHQSPERRKALQKDISLIQWAKTNGFMTRNFHLHPTLFKGNYVNSFWFDYTQKCIGLCLNRLDKHKPFQISQRYYSLRYQQNIVQFQLK